MKQASLPGRLPRPGVVLAAACLLLAADQATKALVLENLAGSGAVTVIPGLLEFSYVENTGAAFGLLQGASWLIAAFAAAAFAVLVTVLFRYRRHTLFSYAALALILSGAVGNLIDRARYGFVVDFIHVLFFGYVFNFADACITVGAVFLVLHALFTPDEQREDGEKAEETENAGDAGGAEDP